MFKHALSQSTPYKSFRLRLRDNANEAGVPTLPSSKYRTPHQNISYLVERVECADSRELSDLLTEFWTDCLRSYEASAFDRRGVYLS